jgi:hypothetical protein
MAIQKKSLTSNLNSSKKTNKPAAGITASEAPTANRAVLSKKIANRALVVASSRVAFSKVAFSKKAL